MRYLYWVLAAAIVAMIETGLCHPELNRLLHTRDVETQHFTLQDRFLKKTNKFTKTTDSILPIDKQDDRSVYETVLHSLFEEEVDLMGGSLKISAINKDKNTNKRKSKFSLHRDISEHNDKEGDNNSNDKADGGGNNINGMVDGNNINDKVDGNNSHYKVDINNINDKVDINNSSDKVDINNSSDKVDINNINDKVDINNSTDNINQNNDKVYDSEMPKDEINLAFRDFLKIDLIKEAVNLLSNAHKNKYELNRISDTFRRNNKSINNDDTHGENDDWIVPQSADDENQSRRRKKRTIFGLWGDQDEEEEPVRRVPDLIRSRGYPSEVHRVYTADGYILELHRIPGPRMQDDEFEIFKKRKKRKVKLPSTEVNPLYVDNYNGAKVNFHRQTGSTTENLTAFVKVHTLLNDTSFTGEKHKPPEGRNSHNIETADDFLRMLYKYTARKNSTADRTDPINIVQAGLQFEGLLDLFAIPKEDKEQKATGAKGSDTFEFSSPYVYSNAQSAGEEHVNGPTTYSGATDETLKLKRSPLWHGHYSANHYSNPRRPPFTGYYEEAHRRRTRPVVIIHHGLFASSANFVLSDAYGGALAYLLADAGYDVWMANWRGNTYSRKHVHLDPNQLEFWNFSLDEIIRFDLPAVINYVLATTGQRQVYYIGHSLGCALLFGATNIDPSLQAKVRLMVAMAPAAFLDHSEGLIRYTMLSMKNYYYLLDHYGIPDLPIPIPIRTGLAKTFCGPRTVFRLPCFLLLDSFMGKVKPQPREYYTHVLLSHFPGTIASTRLMAHFGQFVDSGGMHMFDFGPDVNMERYGQTDPPRYHVNTVSFPVAVMWGPGDTVITPEDVRLCVRLLPNVILNYRVPDPTFNHLDFIFPAQAVNLVYMPILSLFYHYTRGYYY